MSKTLVKFTDEQNIVLHQYCLIMHICMSRHTQCFTTFHIIYWMQYQATPTFYSIHVPVVPHDWSPTAQDMLQLRKYK